MHANLNARTANALVSRRGFLRLAAIASAATTASALLGGCATTPRSEAPASSGASASGAAEELNVEEAASAATSADASASSAAASATATGNVLVAYFSWSGNTEAVAQRIAQDIPGSTLFRIEPATPYSSDYNTVVEVAQQEQREGYIPPMASDVAGFDSFDTVFVGYPLWWYHVPQVVKGFLDAHDFAGKTVVPFDTHGGGGWSQSLADIEAGCAGADILEGLALSGSTVESHLDEVDAWVSSLPIA